MGGEQAGARSGLEEGVAAMNGSGKGGTIITSGSPDSFKHTNMEIRFIHVASPFIPLLGWTLRCGPRPRQERQRHSRRLWAHGNE